MCLSSSGWANECQVPVGIDGRQGRQRFQPVGIPTFNNREIKVVKGFGAFQRELAHFQQRMDGSVYFLPLQMLKYHTYRLDLLLGEILFLRQFGKLNGREIQP